MRENLERGSQADVVLTKTKMISRMKEMSDAFQPGILEPSATANMMLLVPTANFIAQCEQLGEVSTQSAPDPSKCYATGKGIQTAVVGQVSTLTLRILNYNSQPCKDSISLEFELLSDITDAVAKGSVERKGHSQYMITYQPTVKGKHFLNIFVNKQHIRGSPFHVLAGLPVTKAGIPIQTIKNVAKPVGVAITKRGEVVVTEETGHCVSIYKPNGEKIRSFGAYGSGEGQLKSPSGVAVDSKGNIFVADRANHRIQIFTAEGHYLTTVGTEGSGPLQFYYPEGIAFNVSKTKLYVVDGNEHIQVLNSDLSFFGIFGRNGQGDGKFDYPRHVACDSVGNVYVSDFRNHRVQVFTDKGSFVRLFGKPGKGMGELNRPCGVGIDAKDRVYVSQSEDDKVTVFTSEGDWVTSFGSSGEKPGEFRGPIGLAVDGSGVVYVCDYFNQRVQML